MNQKTRIAAFIALSIAGGSWWATAVADRAASAPPIVYTGQILEDGLPSIDGMRSIGLSLWAAPSGATGGLCDMPPQSLATASGYFSLNLSTDCADVFEANEEVYVQLNVDGTPLPRTRVGATPFAVRAEFATEADIATAAETAVLASNGAPPGTIVAYAGGESVPPGWLVCDGSPLSSADFPELFAAIGTSWGAGSGAIANFNLPDLRGRFLRGVDAGAGRDPNVSARVESNPGGNVGDAVGTLQGFATARPGNAFRVRIQDASTDGGDSTSCIDTGSCNGPIRSYAVNDGGDNETRPANASVIYIIKI